MRWVTDVAGGTMTVLMSAGPSADRSEVLIVDGQELRLTCPDRVHCPATGTNQIGRHRVLHDGRAGDAPATGWTAGVAEALAERDRRAVPSSSKRSSPGSRCGCP